MDYRTSSSMSRQGQAVLQRTTAERNYRNTMDAAAGSPKEVVLGSNGTHFAGIKQYKSIL